MEDLKSHRENFCAGMRDGIPIALGYLAVSFTLGIACRNIGMDAIEAFVMSLTNLTSAGEFAALSFIAASSALWEIALSQFVINLRYLLMSFSLSQKLAPGTRWYHRLLVGYGVTDEIFGISVAVPGYLDPYYTYGAVCLSAPGWALGTYLGVVLGNIMPASVVTALSVALYGMFIAVIVPPTKTNRVLGLIVLFSIGASWLFTKLPVLSEISGGMRIIILTVVIAGAAAILFPRKEEGEKDNG